MKIESTFARSMAIVLSLWAADIFAQTTDVISFPGRAQDGFSLVGYLYKPNAGTFAAPYPAIVLMHGRGGAYGNGAKGAGCDGKYTPNACYNLSSLSSRIAYWASRWQQLGYLTLVVDGFGSRGTPEGFAAGTFAERAAMFDPKVARVGDAYAALAYLRTRPDVISNRIGIHGWSNGATATLNSVGVINDFLANPNTTTGFRAAIAFYPGCGTASLRMTAYLNYAPTLLLLSQDDEEVDPAVCAAVATQAIGQGGSIKYMMLPDTDHNFDDPSSAMQNAKRNRPSTTDARRRAELFFEAKLKN